jgi:ferredoxin
VGADVVLGEAAPGIPAKEAWASVVEFEDQTSGERYTYFVQESERCIRCYACREACPMCYCTECFVDHNFPRWLESMITPAGTQAWHIVRAFHQTGRCASCGACERACPMDIKMTYLTDKLNYDMSQQYGFEIGASDDAQPPFATFTLDDEKRFVR